MAWQDDYKELKIRNATRQSVDLVYKGGDTVTVKPNETKRVKTAGLLNAPSLMKFHYVDVEVNNALLIKLGLIDPPPPPPVLADLTVTPTSLKVGQAFVGTVAGKTAGSVLTLSGAGSAGLTVTGNTISGTPTTAGAIHISEALAGAANTPKLTSNVLLVAAFDFDASTYWWDFRDADFLTTDPSGGLTTVSRVKEKTSNKLTIYNSNKGYQPIPEAKGLNFNQSSQRSLSTEQPIPFTNGKNGIYVGFVLYPTVAIGGTVIGITGASGTTLARLWIDFTSSRILRVRFGPADSATLTTIYQSAAQTLLTAVCLETLLNFDTDTPQVWLNGVDAALAAAGPWDNYPATKPQSFAIGNSVAGSASLEANLPDLILYDGVPSSTLRQNFSTYLQNRRLAL